jgi:hypothetical protein
MHKLPALGLKVPGLQGKHIDDLSGEEKPGLQDLQTVCPGTSV